MGYHDGTAFGKAVITIKWRRVSDNSDESLCSYGIGDHTRRRVIIVAIDPGATEDYEQLVYILRSNQLSNHRAVFVHRGSKNPQYCLETSTAVSDVRMRLL